MFGVKPRHRIRVQDSGPGQIESHESLEPLPRPPAALTAPPQRESPVPRDLLPERFESWQIARNWPEVCDSVEPSGFSRFRPRPCCLPLRLTASALHSNRFRSSILSPHVPLSTLRDLPYDVSRMTRGQDGSLLLSCMTLSFTTHCRFSPALQTIGWRRLPACAKVGRPQ